VLGLPELADDARFLTNPDRVANRDELRVLIQGAMLKKTSAEWEEQLLGEGLPCSTIKSVDEVATDPQVEALGLVRPWPHETIDDLRLVDHPISYNGRRSARQDPPPALGEHTRTVLEEFGIDGHLPRSDQPADTPTN
jgi:crotonobetainyl-CoA:carnitine CoA-transferase CaiB-like acyl-CoA transferase